LATNSQLSRMTSFQLSGEPEAPVGPLRNQWNTLITNLEENRQQIVYLLLFFSICAMLFAERYVTYSFLNEHKDLRHVMGPFIALTRGSAASLSFCYALLLLTMSRNLLTRLRDTCLHQYIPIDSHVAFHKVVAMTALFFSILHAVGHLVNFFHISQQSHEHLKCLGIFFHSDAKPGFAHYIFYTVPGATGLTLYAFVCLIFIFAHPKVRTKAFSYFWSVHQLYVVFYAVTLLHGMAKLTGVRITIIISFTTDILLIRQSISHFINQTPRFWIFFIVPAIVFTLDKVISLQTRYMELDILHTDLLPSDVTLVKFARPPNFKYLSGQWIRLACTGFRKNEYHAFTLTSAPHQAHLSVHVKAHGVWTNKLRAYFHPTNQLRLNLAQAKIKLEGPFGGGNQVRLLIKFKIYFNYDNS
jgi:dual oxidase